jgi:hypothetical protein
LMLMAPLSIFLTVKDKNGTLETMITVVGCRIRWKTVNRLIDFIC